MRTTDIIGRKPELETLKYLYDSQKSEFLAIYGRRRVGKSFLIEEAFEGEISFTAVGIFKKDTDSSTYKKTQLVHFHECLIEYGLNREDTPVPESWREAFALLRKLLASKRARKKVVFLDELPWLAGPQSSELVEELGWFWNEWARKQKNIFLIVCGSSTSWMLDNVIRDYGGLHGRLTEKIHLQPFSLKECEEFFSKRGFHMSRYEIALCYMTIGGIPYYMDKLRPNRTLAENIDSVYYNRNDVSQEFKDVYTGLFTSSERYIDIVKALGKKFYGMTRAEIESRLKIKSGGTLSKMLDNLIESGIIKTYKRYGEARVTTVYQLKDFFSLFYLRFIETSSKYTQWRSLQRTPAFYTWAGNSFELLVAEHIPQLCEILRIKDPAESYCWTGKTPDEKNVQIDLLIPAPMERTDYLCEIKFSENTYSISADYEASLRNKLEAFINSKQHKKTHSLQLVMVTSFGLSKSIHNGSVNSTICLDQLFN